MTKNSYRLIKERWYHKLWDKLPKLKRKVKNPNIHHYYGCLEADDKGKVLNPFVKIEIEPSPGGSLPLEMQPEKYFSGEMDVGQALTEHQKSKLGIRRRTGRGLVNFERVYSFPLGLEKYEGETFYFRDLHLNHKFHFDLAQAREAVKPTDEEEELTLEEIGKLLHRIKQ